MTNADNCLPLDIADPMRRCWYCGSATALVYEWEHQLPISRGGGAGHLTVDSCQFHNRLKGDRTLEEFRDALAERIGIAPEDLVFAGEATNDHQPTDIASIRSLADDRDSVRLHPEAGAALRRAHLMHRGGGDARTSLTALASRYMHEGAQRDLQARRQQQLFDPYGPDEIPEPETPSQLDPPKVPQRRRVIKIDAQLHEAVVAAVLLARTRGRPHMLVVDAMDEAAADFVLRTQDELNDGEPLPPLSTYTEADVGALRRGERSSTA